MPMDSGTPDLVRHCVAAVAKQYGGDTQKAFAICVAQLQKNGYLKPGTMELTAAGKKKEKEHEAEPDAKKKLAAYEKLLKANRKEESALGEAIDSYLGYEIATLNSYSTPYYYAVGPKPLGSLNHFGTLKQLKSYMDKLVKQGKLSPKNSKTESRSMHYDYEALLDRDRKSGFEETPRPVARKYETVTRSESTMDAMRRMAGITPRHTDRSK